MSKSSEDKRPDIWMGHIEMKSAKLADTVTCLTRIGLRSVFDGDGIHILELRGGTHLIVSMDAKWQGTDVPFDFMVEDIQAIYAKFRKLDLQLSELNEGRVHTSFTLTEPGGNRIVVNSTHVEDHNLV